MKRVVVRDWNERRSQPRLHVSPWTAAATETKNVRGNVERGSGHGIVASRSRMGKRHDANCRLQQPEPGNRQVPKRNPKKRLLLWVDSLEAQRETPAIPVLSIVPLAVVSAVRMLLVQQSASEESV